MGNTRANERTALSGAPFRYDTVELPPAATGTSAAPGPAGMIMDRDRSVFRLAVAVISTSVMFLAAVLLSATIHIGSTPRSSSSSGSDGASDLASITGSTTKIIPSMQPFSTVNPADAFCPHMDRPEDTWPTSAWGALANSSVRLHTSLPTNAWWENIVLGFPSQETGANNIVVIPYTFDVAGDSAGLRIHFPQVVASDLIVQTAFDWRHALQLGCVEEVGTHYVSQPGPLSVTLNWDLAAGINGAGAGIAAMSVPAVRGSPYATMEYRGVRPVVSARQEVTQLIVDGEPMSLSSGCKNGTSLHVEREVEIVFSGGAVSSDDTWLVFFSHPAEFLCSSWFAMERGDPPTPGALGAWQSMPRFKLEAVEPLSENVGVVRVAMVNTCSSGTSNRCEKRGEPDDKEDYASLLRAHAELYPTGEARVSYSSSSLDWIQDALQGRSGQTTEAAAVAREESNVADSAGIGVDGSAEPEFGEGTSRSDEEEGSLRFLWAPRRMDGKPITDVSRGHASGGGGDSSSSSSSSSSSADSDSNDNVEVGGASLITYALLHHQQSFTAADGLTDFGTPTLHGEAKIAIGDEWSMKVALPPVSFGVGRPVRDGMVEDINEALDKDVQYEIPENYLRGEGDTYFSGKMLAKMGRIALIAEEMGRPEDAKMVAARLAEASQVWLNGTAGSPLIYDFRWGGVVTCGCAYEKGHGCTNGIGPYDCPGLSDPGMNFGLGFYNDHHFHFGYHIFAAAIAAKFFPEWGMKHHEAVTLLIRDIANPSSSDPFFPVFRHKDWFLGSSWALGIPTLGGVPYMNGRNQESSSEAVNAYYGVALYGHVMAQEEQRLCHLPLFRVAHSLLRSPDIYPFPHNAEKVFAAAGKPAKAQTASLIRDTGRQLLATEVQSAQIYWQVANVDTPDMPRVYPEAYRPHVVGMLWSTLAQMQTWFGAEAWKVYGIQMLPITGVSEQLLDPRWVQQMLPSFEDSCLYDSNPIKACVVEGWSMLVHAGQAITGRWEDGRDGILALPDDAFETAGGNGHSRTSMLWFVANRPPPPPVIHGSTSDSNDAQ